MALDRSFLWLSGTLHLSATSLSSVSRHLDCLRVLAVVNSAAIDIGVPVSYWRFVSRYMVRSGIVGSYVVLFLVF